MKRRLAFVIVVVFIASHAFAQLPLQSETGPTETRIHYADLEGHPVELIVTSLQKVALCVRTDGTNRLARNPALDFLEKEVRRLFTSMRHRAIDNTGKVFDFRGGYPTWIPFTAAYGGGDFECLRFAENAKISGDLISAEGSSERVGFGRPPNY